MIILGIDTSCDDTCISVIKSGIRKEGARRRREGGEYDASRGVVKFEILSNIVSSQVKLHAKYGGVYPSLAKREHQKNLSVVFKKALRQAQGKQLDLIGVTTGPGLEPCLWQGVNFAKDLARKLNLPIIPVNHIEAHILANWLSPIRSKSKIIFPTICLVVSGGHTQLILTRNIGQYKLIGETRDDAAGECFDKVARILGLGYPGGPAIARIAAQWKSEIRNPKSEIKLPRPMMYTKDYDFSFSGLKTAVLYSVRQLTVNSKQLTIKQKREFCHEAQQAIIDVLIHKTLRAAKNYRVKSIILGGGVAANDELRKQFKEKIQKEIPNTEYYIPDTKYCTDNAAMVVATSYFHQKEATKNWQKIKVDANLKI
ncbi:MAG: tRNA (adenosine(37)-N6)-threonylcarbamoyltransferase complex transferase subunit TsaD [Candidatus Nealsonbacteria bacterium CG_4_8_14_3_um_filter_37_36]|uniref:tRNA N6-adenosine threonylcarbamoyltransferase n=4 Tax=Candidatus Nealsoniibacteriota TaxID=1817911 RepID=A0A2M7EBT1_9BACT|nr:MAG: tRNA (adenosine(37)-N6)-threonylcarbamoyltransferase complex transferase subunit TsaD [Candidatus Nealsonbacteria bacterium CG01_land_8_20_14_3_00_12]PIW35044.1 MAG: tRNA (adenosine(37)-N6)-threonylcarbamoyltransferase complex transferase subunit TsaD [Candidatus Nealsonbacteria bacterium CG15_BIG_FIL_POST_REV_8_21_14_020_37_12]PIW91606.1 MAG: tRNA (adenosine(37)-N6)-threonylcarbamoyltransferase complex transferase subunit TsaD [Candidatus Nealsonbacteria bacterium CG_4_8_14_3_um_filter_3